MHYPDEIVIGGWRARRNEGGIERDGEFRRLEPKVMDLLFLLGSRPGEVFTREEIIASLWPDVVVGDDSLARCVAKLRRALDDDAQAPRFIQTVPKRGYSLRTGGTEARGSRRRLLIATAVVVPLVAGIALTLAMQRPEPVPVTAEGADALVDRGLEYYARYTRMDNESAIELFQRALALNPDNARALSALANALGQRALRWPDEAGQPPPRHTTLTNALRENRLGLPNARLNLDAARAFAERSVQLAPDSAAAHKAKGLVLSAQGEIVAAIETYEHALALDPRSWGVMINLSELYDLKEEHARALQLLQQAYELQPEYADLGALIGERHEQAGRLQEAQLWYRNVLSHAPFHRKSTVSLARLLAASGDPAEAARLCGKLIDRTGPYAPCDTFRIREPDSK